MSSSLIKLSASILLASACVASADHYRVYLLGVSPTAMADELRGMLWQQGETDTGSATGSNNYETNLTNLIARVRTDLAGGASPPFVIGSLSDSQYSDISTPGTGPYKVRQAQEVVAAADPTVGLVITDGYTVRADGIHFDHDGQIALGQAHAEAMQVLEAPPNVIFIISDDQPWYDFSFMYRPEYEKTAIDAQPSVRQVATTPAIDRLADEGLTFTLRQRRAV